jgi:hypothetical protein
MNSNSTSNRPANEAEPLPHAPRCGHEWQNWVDGTSYEHRLALCAWFMQACWKNARLGGNFRTLLYEHLGFNADAYVVLYLAGGMDLTTHFHFTEAADTDEMTRQVIARAADRCTEVRERDPLVAAMMRFERLAEDCAAWSIVIARQRQELDAQTKLIEALQAALASREQ